MGDKGGKKDRIKSQKQRGDKQEKKQKAKVEKQQKDSPARILPK